MESKKSRVYQTKYFVNEDDLLKRSKDTSLTLSDLARIFSVPHQVIRRKLNRVGIIRSAGTKSISRAKQTYGHLSHYFGPSRCPKNI